MAASILPTQRYLASKRLDSRPKTVDRFDLALGRFVAWLTAAHPELDSLGEVTREHVVEYAAALDGMISMQTARLLSRRTARAVSLIELASAQTST